MRVGGCVIIIMKQQSASDVGGRISSLSPRILGCRKYSWQYRQPTTTSHTKETNSLSLCRNLQKTQTGPDKTHPQNTAPHSKQ